MKQLEIDLDGKHLNVCGKEITYQELAMIIGQFYKRKQLASFYIPWKDSSLDGVNSESQELNTKDEITKSSQPPKCRWNCPALRNPDFLRT